MRRPASLLRCALRVLSVAVAAAVAYDGWVFYSRWRNSREVERARQAEEIRRARQTLDAMGGTQFRIINFYAVPQVIHHGEAARICFGVYGAKRVHIEPGVGDVHPAMTDCLQVSPRKDTEYKLTAEDGAGHTVEQSLKIRVAP